MDEANPSGREVVRLVGDQLRRMRDGCGWTRPDLVKRLATPIPVNTYSCYEQAIRPIPMYQFVEVCRLYHVSPGAALDAALEQSLDITWPTRKEFTELCARVEALEAMATNSPTPS